jgi:hypothetical protein
MKAKNTFTKFVILSGLIVAVLPLVAWSPPVGAGDQKIVVGTNNTTQNFQGFITGKNNTANTDGGTEYGLVVGNGNMANRCEKSIVSGAQHTTFCSTSLVAGYGNTVGSGWSNLADNSMAVGQLNQVSSDGGWTIGYQNLVSGSRGVAIGTGTKANTANGTALGKFNASMATTDVLAVGTGTSDTTRSTALRVTSDGSVILGRAQGDISMGNYE